MPADPLHPVGPAESSWTRLVAKLETRFFDNGLWYHKEGTGFLYDHFGNKHFLLTAAHNLYSHELIKSPMVKEILISLGLSGTVVQATIQYPSPQCQRIYIPKQFIDTHAYRSDLALIRIDQLPSDFTYFKARSEASTGERAAIFGYPKDVSRLQEQRIQLVVSSKQDRLHSFDYTEPVDIPGLSGAPLLVDSNDADMHKVVGVHIRGDAPHRAVRLTEQNRSELSNWMKQQH